MAGIIGTCVATCNAVCAARPARSMCHPEQSRETSMQRPRVMHEISRFARDDMVLNSAAKTHRRGRSPGLVPARAALGPYRRETLHRGRHSRCGATSAHTGVAAGGLVAPPCFRRQQDTTRALQSPTERKRTRRRGSLATRYGRALARASRGAGRARRRRWALPSRQCE